jgi:phage gp36-like protein
MSFITTAELNTHLYDEQVAEIVRADTAIAPASIDAAIQEMKGYLQAYDTVAIFTAIGAARNALVLLFCKDIAVWHLIALASPDIEYKLREERYKRAIQWLRDVQQRKTIPELPLVPILPGEGTGETTHSGGNGGYNSAMSWGSNPKRNNQFS